MIDKDSTQPLEKKALARLDSEEWLKDDGLGTNLFGDVSFTDLAPKKGAELDQYIDDIKESVRVAIDQSVDILTPWFFSNMPQFYYQTTPRSEKIRDLHAIITGHIFEGKQQLQLWNRDRTKTTFLAPGSDEHVFEGVAEKIQRHTVKHGSMFTSNDRLLLIASFFTDQFQPADLSNPKNAEKIEAAKLLLKEEDPARVMNFLENLDDQMVVHTTPERLARMFILFNLVRNREDAVTHLIPQYFGEFTRWDIAYKKMPVSQVLSTLLHLFRRYGFTVSRSVMVECNSHTNSPVTIFTFIFRHESGQQIDENFVPFLKLNKAAKTLRWVDTDHYDELWQTHQDESDSYSLNEINLIRAISAWVQVFLSKKNPYYYSEERIRKTFKRYPAVLRGLTQYFKYRFDPRLGDHERQAAAPLLEKLRENAQFVSNPVEEDIFNESLNFLKHILKTNYFFPRKTGLAFRMDPDCLNPAYYPNKPFGFFFMIGRGYRGFQVRFRDTARGGLRILMPRDGSQYEVSFAGLFDEVIGLAYAQQLKNKDIPEGGSKAVLLLAPGADRETAALGAVDSILNLINVNPKTGRLAPTIIDYFRQPEYIYLGPDENCTNELIDAFVKQAHRHGYRYANAFMSSKPGAGINHKEFGVTSEGVNVFLDNMLTVLGINPREQDFTVKMTGGPDGDVAGNELKILHREYGDHAKVLAIADGFGAAYDPQGLAWPELLRLVREGKPIVDFNVEMLSGNESAFVIPADTKDHIQIRNNLHANVEADILIPAGGRPYTVNGDNWRNYLDKKGTPRVRAIVEGANIFFTEDAREHLQNAGVLIFKDSSANKCGVICSSFEILASLILTPDEFLAMKPEYVPQVLQKLREKADLEAKLLLREHSERGGRVNLVELSKILSNVINRVTDLVSKHLDKLSDEEFSQPLYNRIILDYAPKVLEEKYADRILKDIPRSYRQAIVCADTAARMVYHEGISWFENLNDADVIHTLEIYNRKLRDVQDLVREVEAADLQHKGEIRRILELSGARTLTKLERQT